VKRLRSQIRGATSKQIVIRRWSLDVTPQVVRERHLLEQLIAEWANNKPIPLLRFLVDLHPFSFSNERRYYVANYQNKYVGFAVLAPVFARNGWLIENLFRAHDAPNGTSELLVDAAMRDAALSGNEYVTLGMVPLSGAVDAWLRVVKKWGAFFYNFRGLKAFKAKFRPNEWSPIYLTYPREQSGLVAVYDSLVAFANGGLCHFGSQALFRKPGILLRRLTTQPKNPVD
jgi:phosphatidylglycerol lysyltransferase